MGCKKLLFNNSSSPPLPPPIDWVDVPVGSGADYGKLITPIVLFDTTAPADEKLLLEIECISYRTSSTASPNISFFNSNAHTVTNSIKMTAGILVKDQVIEIKVFHTSNFSIRVEWKKQTESNWSSGNLSMTSNNYCALKQINDMKSMKAKIYI